jgi:hypothetical protein
MNKMQLYSIKKDNVKIILLTVMASVLVSISLTILSQYAFAQTARDYDYRLEIRTYNGPYMQPNRDTRIYVENMETGYYNSKIFTNGYPPGAVMYWYDSQMPVGSEFQVCFGYDDASRPINCEYFTRGNEVSEFVELNLAP